MAGFGWLRKRGTGNGISVAGYRFCGRFARVWFDGFDRGVRARSHIGWSLQSGGSIGLWAGKRFPANELLPYVAAQVLGAIAGAGILFVIARGKTGFSAAGGGFASNGFDAHSPGSYTALAAFVSEVVMTFFFLVVILGVTSKRAPKGFAPLAIGLCLTLIHLISIPVTNTSVNPARSTGPALFVAIDGASWPVTQLWMFWVAPILGALLAGFIFTWLNGDDDTVVVETVEEIVVIED